MSTGQMTQCPQQINHKGKWRGRRNCFILKRDLRDISTKYTVVSFLDPDLNHLQDKSGNLNRLEIR